MAKKDFAAQVGGVIDLYEPEDETAEKGTQTVGSPDDEKGDQTVDTPGDDLSDSEVAASSDTPSRTTKQHPNAGKLQPGYVRYTVILSRDELDQLKGYAWYTRRKIKDIFAEMVGEFLENHADELPKRGE